MNLERGFPTAPKNTHPIEAVLVGLKGSSCRTRHVYSSRLDSRTAKRRVEKGQPGASLACPRQIYPGLDCFARDSTKVPEHVCRAQCVVVLSATSGSFPPPSIASVLVAQLSYVDFGFFSMAHAFLDPPLETPDSEAKEILIASQTTLR